MANRNGAAARGLLTIFAHPDDESFGAGGLMALAAAAGNPVGVLCVTNGDQGGLPGEMGVDHSMDPEIRRAELACACRALGVAEPIFLGFRDSGMEGWGAPEGSLALADPEDAIGRMVEVVRRLRPAVIVTFDPGGVYGHPDHRKTSEYASQAFRRTSREPGGPIALYHQALPKSRIVDMRAQMEEERRRSGDNTPMSEDDRRQAEEFERLARPDDEITTIVDVGEGLHRKLAALACHESQMRGRDWHDPEIREQYRRMFGQETFVRVEPVPAAGERETLPMALEWKTR
jgi:N-acetyl-1-D-myo-inositol-2-amino-2-deoxy-alpha-D-glucopyranoside deacetylase